jgi:hypothetical protein
MAFTNPVQFQPGRHERLQGAVMQALGQLPVVTLVGSQRLRHQSAPHL